MVTVRDIGHRQIDAFLGRIEIEFDQCRSDIRTIENVSSNLGSSRELEAD